ncbi:hypothetical protein ATCC90586_005322 [Pythium insidiosum]|nr:hypothetical protein ATCC90586_005322 [Pythium insidiosum]
MQATTALSSFDLERKALPEDLSHEDLQRLYGATDDARKALPEDLSHEDLQRLYGATDDAVEDAPVVESLEKCKFFDRFNLDIHKFNADQEKKKNAFIEKNGDNAWWDIMFMNKHHDLKSRRSVDYRLNKEEHERLRSNGVVVLSRLAHESFGDAYYSIYNNDLPVFVTADSILHAWHRSFDDILIETETQFVMWKLLTVLRKSIKTIHDLPDSVEVANAEIESQGSRGALEALLANIKDHNLGGQAVAGHPYFTEDIQCNGGLPLSFAMLGQQFTLGSFVLSNVVFDTIKYKGIQVDRRVPSVSLDVGFALMGNDAAVPELARRMGRDTSQASGVDRLRDGLPYTNNLVALRRTVDAIYRDGKTSSESIGDQWVGVLRQLSEKCPTASPTFHTNAWKLRQLTTQIASFTQLRHDTLLYTKQSNTMMLMCEYPAGYVEPYPEFWKAFQRMVERLTILLPLDNVKAFLVGFGDTLARLREISEYQRDTRQLTWKQKEFLRDIIEVNMGSGSPSYAGWYPGLFFKSREDAVEADYIVADVHTDVPTLTSPGHVVHLGVGNVFSGLFVVDDVMYTGPVFSSYEVVTPFPTRLTDQEFSKSMRQYSCEPWAEASYLS